MMDRRKWNFRMSSTYNLISSLNEFKHCTPIIKTMPSNPTISIFCSSWACLRIFLFEKYAVLLCLYIFPFTIYKLQILCPNYPNPQLLRTRHPSLLFTHFLQREVSGWVLSNAAPDSFPALTRGSPR